MGELSEQGAADLRDALEFISAVRLRHQVRRIRQQLPPNNFVPPDQLSHFERNHLKDAFALVRTMQSVLGQRFQSGRLG
ncbi:MAG: putative nucleotidyltransferase substrate binding domain-containing protein [Gammaproteobacteria bacterium]